MPSTLTMVIQQGSQFSQSLLFSAGLCHDIRLPFPKSTHHVAEKRERDFSHSPRGWKSRIKVLEILISGENSFLVLQMLTFWLCPYMTERERVLVSLPLLIRTSILSNQIPALMTSFNINYPQRCSHSCLGL